MNSKKYIRKFSKRLFQANKKRNSLIIITIAVAIFFSCTMMYLYEVLDAFTFMKNLQSYGTEAEAEYRTVTFDEYLKMQEVGLFQEISYGIDLYKTTYNQYNNSELYIRYFEEDAANWSFEQLRSGRWPETADEVVVDQGFCRNMEKVSIGDYFYIEALDASFCVSGISSGERNSIYVSKAGWEAKEALYKKEGQVYVRLATVENADMILQQKWDTLFTKEPMYVVNYVYQYDAVQEQDILQSLAADLGILFIVFIITLVSVYSVYYFAMLKDMKMYSLLRLQGMQKMQVNLIVKYQAVFQFVLGAPIGVMLSILFCNIIIPWLCIDILHINISVSCDIKNYIMAVCICLFALILGIYKPIRIMTKLSAIQAVGFNGVKSKSFKPRKAKRFSVFRMAVRNIQRNSKRAMLVSFCISLVALVFVLNTNLMKSISKYYDYLYATTNDYVIGSRDFVYLLSNYDGMYTDEEMKNSTVALFYSDKGDYLLEMDKAYFQEIHHRCEQDIVEAFYFNFAVINEEKYVDKVKHGLEEELYSIEQADIYESYLKRNKDEWLPQLQYYVNFSQLEACRVLEGELNQELFETGEYVVLIYDSSLQEEPLYHVGDKMPVGSIDSNIAFHKAYDFAGGEIDWSKSEIEDSTKEVEVLAIVENTSELFPISGSNACFLSVSNIDVNNDENITLYCITIDTKGHENVDMIVKEVLETKQYEVSGNEIIYLSDVARKELKQQDSFIYNVFCGGITIVLGIIACMNLLNNCILGIIERKEELMILHAVGMNKKQIIRMLRIENCIITGSGAVVGCCVGMVVSKMYVLGEYGRYYHFDEYVAYNPSLALVFVGVVLLISVIFPNKRMKLGA